MQQTEKYKLNLIEPSDPFLPKDLNKNTLKIEEVLQTHMEGPVADLKNRVAVLEGFRAAYGLIIGSGSETHVGFKPLAVLVNDLSGGRSTLAVEGCKNPYLELTEDGFIPGFGGTYAAFGRI